MLGVVVVAALAAPTTGRATVATDVAAEADWIMSARLPDGAIANYVDRQAVWPYLSNFAAMGLAKASVVTNNTSYVAAAWTWLSWYQAHENAQGFVTDYRMTNGTLTSTNDMDSTDSYAGTFLLAAREAYRATSDLTKLKGLATGIAGAVKAIEATQDVDGLTWAKPAWRVKYLMDQSEAYAGLLAAVDIAKAIGNNTLSKQSAADATKMKNGVANLWNSGVAAYDWAVHDDGGRQPNDWKVLYSDSLQQAWAVAFGLVDSARAPTLVTRFNGAQPNWALPAATALFSSGQALVGYWPAAGLAFDAVQSTVASTAAASIRAGALAAGRAWPYTTGNAGQLILFQAGYALPLAQLPTTTTSTTTTTIARTTTTRSSTAATTTTAKATTTTTAPKPSTTTTRPTTTTTALLSASVSTPPATVKVGP